MAPVTARGRLASSYSGLARSTRGCPHGPGSRLVGWLFGFYAVPENKVSRQENVTLR